MTAEPVLDRDGRPTGEYIYAGAIANRALELLGKEIGMFIDRREQGRPGEFAEMSDGELHRIASESGAGVAPAEERKDEPHQIH
jgi:hypothetical protein